MKLFVYTLVFMALLVKPETSSAAFQLHGITFEGAQAADLFNLMKSTKSRQIIERKSRATTTLSIGDDLSCSHYAKTENHICSTKSLAVSIRQDGAVLLTGVRGHIIAEVLAGGDFRYEAEKALVKGVLVDEEANSVFVHKGMISFKCAEMEYDADQEDNWFLASSECQDASVIISNF